MAFGTQLLCPMKTCFKTGPTDLYNYIYTYIAPTEQYNFHICVGTSIGDEGGMETAIIKRVRAPWRNWNKYSGVGLLCDRRMPVKLKGKVYKTGAG